MTERAPQTHTRPAVRRSLVAIGALVASLVVLALAIPLAATSAPGFFSRYDLLDRRYVNLGDSAHEGISCRTCHETDAVSNGGQLVGDFYASTFRKTEVPKYFSFGSPRREACLRCHGTEWKSGASKAQMIPHPAHLNIATETRECVDCHRWTAHLETYMDKHKEMPFSGVCVSYGCHVGTKKSDQCLDCHHVLHEDAKEWKTAHPAVIKRTGDNICLESCHKVEECQTCHTTGQTPKFSGRPIQKGLDEIEALHVRDDWTVRYHGDLAIKDRSKCLLCHQSEGECQECHRYRPAFHGEPTAWIGRHAKQTKDVEDPRCIECHEKPWCVECHDQFKEME